MQLERGGGVDVILILGLMCRVGVCHYMYCAWCVEFRAYTVFCGAPH